MVWFLIYSSHQCSNWYTDPLDTTVRLKYSLKLHPELTTPEAIANLLAPFGALDTESIVLSLKAPKKSAGKPPKTGTALVPFKQIGDAFGAVCASGRADRGLEGIDIGWVNGKEPQILGWLKKLGKLGDDSSPPKPPSPLSQNSNAGAKAELPQHQATGSSGFSTFPSTFVSRGFSSAARNADVMCSLICRRHKRRIRLLQGREWTMRA